MQILSPAALPQRLRFRFLAASLASILFLLLLPFSVAWGHVGSPDVFFEGNAGPYHLFVTVRVPQVIPGIAQIEIRTASSDVREIKIAPMQLTGPGSQYAPTPDVAQRSKSDPQFFTGNLWLMEFGSLQVRVSVDGARGPVQLAVPVPAVAQRTLPMQKPLGFLLFGLMLFLGFAIVSIASAAVREGDLPAGAVPSPSKLRRARLAMVVAALVVASILFLGGEWWKADDTRFARRVYTPPELDSPSTPDGRLLLHQKCVHIPAGNPRRPTDLINFDNLILDHGHLMHFFLIRIPQMDIFWHLHPVPQGHGDFSLNLPALPAGHYQLFADVVLTSGFPVTMVGQLDLPALPGKPLVGDDSGLIAAPIPQDANASNLSLASLLPDGGRMIWQRPPGALKANTALLFQFQIQDKDGKPAQDLEPYMGMAAHAAIIRSDASVFAHVHPSGSVAMAALDLAQMGGATSSTAGQDTMSGMPGMSSMDMPGMSRSNSATPLSPEISFPYGFPKPGLYRIFVQIKRAGHVQTGVFDTLVD